MSNRAVADGMGQPGDILTWLVSRWRGMTGTGATQAWHSQQGGSFLASASSTVYCSSGMVWITQGDGRDYVLLAGQSLRLDPRDRVVVQPMTTDARFHAEEISDWRPARRRSPAIGSVAWGEGPKAAG